MLSRVTTLFLPAVTGKDSAGTPDNAINTLLLYRAVPAGFMIQPSRLKVHLQKWFPVCFSPSAALFAIPDFLLFFSLPI